MKIKLYYYFVAGSDKVQACDATLLNNDTTACRKKLITAVGNIDNAFFSVIKFFSGFGNGEPFKILIGL